MGKQFRVGSWASAELTHMPKGAFSGRWKLRDGAKGEKQGEREGDWWSVGPAVVGREGNGCHTLSVMDTLLGAFTQVILSNPLWSQK